MTKTTMLFIAAFLFVGGGFYYVVSEPSDDDIEEQDEDEPRANERAPRGERVRTVERVVREGGSGDLERRVAALEKELKVVKAQVRMQRGASVISAGSGGGEEPTYGEGGGGGLAELVREIMEEEREADRERRSERRQERMKERNAEAIQALAAATNIGAAVQTDISALWTAESEQIQEIFSQARGEDRDWGQLRDEIQKLRTETDAAAKELLSEDQHAAYDENRPGLRGGPGRGRRGGGDGGGGGGWGGGGPRGGGRGE